MFYLQIYNKRLGNPGDVSKKTFIESLITKIDRWIETIDGYEDLVDFDSKILWIYKRWYQMAQELR